MFLVLKSLIENIVRANKLYIHLMLFLTWTKQKRRKENLQKKNVTFLHCSVAFRVDFDYYYEMIFSFIYGSYILQVFRGRGCQEKDEAISQMVFCLAWTKSKDQIASSESLSGVTTVFVYTRLWKTKHSRKRLQNFRQSYVLATCRIEIHQSQPLV